MENKRNYIRKKDNRGDYDGQWGLTRFWCSCNEPRLWDSNTKSIHGSQHLFDPYSFCHAEFGAIQYLIFNKFGYKYNLLLHIIWEIIENSPMIIEHFRATEESFDYEGDSIVNFLGDLMSFSFGYLSFKSRSKKKDRLFIIFILELIPYILIKQNSLLLIKSSIKTIFHEISSKHEQKLNADLNDRISREFQ